MRVTLHVLLRLQPAKDMMSVNSYPCLSSPCLYWLHYQSPVWLPGFTGCWLHWMRGCFGSLTFMLHWLMVALKFRSYNTACLTLFYRLVWFLTALVVLVKRLYTSCLSVLVVWLYRRYCYIGCMAGFITVLVVWLLLLWLHWLSGCNGCLAVLAVWLLWLSTCIVGLVVLVIGLCGSSG